MLRIVPLVLALGVLGGAAAAASGDECPTWFPDFRCDREARPEGSVMPMSFPYLFEDPYITTGLNLVGIWHEFPNSSVFGGGDISVVALQIRAAITDKLAFIATKDGVGWTEPDNKVRNGPNNGVFKNETGLFNLGFGFKYALFQWESENAEMSAILTPAIRYEAPSGMRAVFQGHDKGIFIPSASGAFHWKRLNFIANFGGQAPIDLRKNSSNFFYNVHVDYSHPTGWKYLSFVTPFIEYNGIQYTSSGDGSRLVSTNLGNIPLSLGQAALGVGPFEGVDVANLGSRGVTGDSFMTFAWGLRLQVMKGVSIGASYEVPLAQKHIWQQRVTTNLTWEL